MSRMVNIIFIYSLPKQTCSNQIISLTFYVFYGIMHEDEAMILNFNIISAQAPALPRLNTKTNPRSESETTVLKRVFHSLLSVWLTVKAVCSQQRVIKHI